MTTIAERRRTTMRCMAPSLVRGESTVRPQSLLDGRTAARDGIAWTVACGLARPGTVGRVDGRGGLELGTKQLPLSQKGAAIARRVHDVGDVEIGSQVVNVLQRHVMAHLVRQEIRTSGGGDGHEGAADLAGIAARCRPIHGINKVNVDASTVEADVALNSVHVDIHVATGKGQVLRAIAVASGIAHRDRREEETEAFWPIDRLHCKPEIVGASLVGAERGGEHPKGHRYANLV